MGEKANKNSHLLEMHSKLNRILKDWNVSFVFNTDSAAVFQSGRPHLMEVQLQELGTLEKAMNTS